MKEYLLKLELDLFNELRSAEIDDREYILNELMMVREKLSVC